MEITPRLIGEVLSLGTTILGRVWRRLIPPAFGAFVVLGGLTIVTFAVTGADDFVRLVLNDPRALDNLTDEELFEPGVKLVQATSIAVALQLLATGFVNLAVHRIVATEIGGTPVGSGEASIYAVRRLGALAAAGLMAIVSIFLGLVALVIPGIWLAGQLTMVSPVIALENVGPFGAIRRSFSLVKGRWWQTIGFLVLVGLLGSIAAQLVQLIALPALATEGVGLGSGLGFVILIVVQGLVVAAIAVMTTVWYLDLRARKESLLTTNLI